MIQNMDKVLQDMDKVVQDAELYAFIAIILVFLFFFFALMAHLTIGPKHRFHYEGCNIRDSNV